MARNTWAYNMAKEWVVWLDSKRFFAPPEKAGILARLTTSASNKLPPNAPLSPELAAFNLVVCALPENLFIPFIVVYAGCGDKPVKSIAHEFNCHETTFYRRADLATKGLKRKTFDLVELHRQMARESDTSDFAL
jgi:hypothetical protein